MINKTSIYSILKIYINSGFQLAQLVKSLMVEQESPSTPKTDWYLGQMIKS